MKFCNIKKYILGAFLIGIGIGIWLCRIFGLGYFFTIVFIGIGIWRIL